MARRKKLRQQKRGAIVGSGTHIRGPYLISKKGTKIQRMSGSRYAKTKKLPHDPWEY